ncbi:oxygen-dependent protoporphyrinogen oxidase [Pedococcus cremeus]|uniref:Coproporphyrinogen III oxidase n=1 Tax=Pedococcus cremeus TaxID=587636 RepID=A0A1H9TCE9_9MICO|nr:protoporphyrinogen oxidase [Pedococcus cremeus]SER94293.1 oxygen-dependent protoporphyrinogen oxidase [Pedococcus cremeus]
MSSARVIVVGGGISGLAAAWELSQRLPGAHIRVLDASDRPGGKLRLASIAGQRIDVGAESMLARRPEAVGLVEEIGAADLLTHPATTAANVWSRGRLHPLPKGTLMGVPGVVETARGLLTDDEVDRAAHEEPWTGGPLEDDVAVGDYVGARLGSAVVDRLVEPLLGGVYAGHARRLSLQACVPGLFEVARSGGSLTAAARAAAAAGAANPAPVFAGVVGGMGRFAELLVDALRARGVEVCSGVIARELRRRSGRGWTMVTGPRPAPESIDADAVVLAVPATPTSRLLGEHAPEAAEELAGIEYASMAIVTLAVAREGLGELPGSGFLVPPVDGRGIKASTFSSAKWPWVDQLSDEAFFVRASVGRADEEADLQRPDEELVRLAAREVSEALGRTLPPVLDAQVQRWGGGLPQYAVGHRARVARVRASVADLPGLEVAGAAYDGVGIPACIASGRTAAEAVATHLTGAGEEG